MNLNNIKTNYYVLANLSRNNKTILLCQDRINLEYKFFYNEKNNYSLVNTDVENELKKVYNVKATNVSYFEYSDDYKKVAGKNLGKINIEMFEEICYEYIRTYFTEQQMPTEFLKKRFNNISINISSVLNEKNGNVGGNSDLACYFPADDTIYVNENYYIPVSAFLHELLHAITAKHEFDGVNIDTGLIETRVSNLENRAIVCNSVGIAINEGATEYYARKIIEGKAPHLPSDSVYNHCCDIYSKLVKIIGKETSEDIYLYHNVSRLIDELTIKAGLPDKEKATALILQLDALYKAEHEINNSEDIWSIYKVDVENIMLSAYYNLVDICLYDAYKKGETFDATKFFEFPYLEDQDRAYFYKFLKLNVEEHITRRAEEINNNNFDFIKTISLNEPTRNVNKINQLLSETQYYAKNLITKTLFNNKITSEDLPIEYRNEIFFSFVLENYRLVQGMQIINEYFINKFTNLIMKSDCPILPTNLKEKSRVVTAFMLNCNYENNKNLFDEKLVNDCLNVPKFNIFMIDKYPKNYTEKIKDIKPEIFTNPIVITRMFTNSVFLNLSYENILNLIPEKDKNNTSIQKILYFFTPEKHKEICDAINSEVTGQSENK